MIMSMTGFGRGLETADNYEIECEIKGVNHRYLDINIRMPRRYTALEELIKEEVKKKVSRGRLEISININKTNYDARNIKVDKELAIAYHSNLKELAEKLDISPQISIIDLFRLPEVFSLEDETEDLTLIGKILCKSVNDALDGFLRMRIQEGEKLVTDIIKRNDFIDSQVEVIEARSPVVTQEYAEKLRIRLAELDDLDKAAIDESRLMFEIALFADKSNITEEIVRLKSHISYLRELLTQQQAIGRKCDFLLQEMFREINTVGSKASDLEINKNVVEIKAELEKIREQIQNIE